MCAEISTAVCKKVCFHGTENVDCNLLNYAVSLVHSYWCLMGHGFCVFIVEMKTDVAGPSEMLVTTLTYNPENHNTYLL